MIVVDGTPFRKSLEALGEEFRDLAADALELAVDEAAKDAFSTSLYRNHTWKLRSGTKGTVNRVTLRGRLTNAVKYAPYVEYGTKPHEIKARKVPRLVFYWHRFGTWVRTKKVQHPGTSPRPFMRHAADVGTSRLNRELQSRVDRAVHRFSSAA